ncbi:hypothetical protein [Xanthomonas cassavae]|uniref:hypothetical protein n=1 Tax=Xanthomonas cassavae TaxID=56450 RepID=UPI001F45DD7A|nr:hypothetical protein [Xanthomonas cassavae]
MKLLMLVGLAVVMTCMSSCKQKMKWKEQVWLDEGRFIEVERQASGKFDFPNSSSIVTTHQELRYKPLGVIWVAEGSAQVQSFYVVGNDAYLIEMAAKSRNEFCIGRRKGDYLLDVMRWRGGKMQLIDQNEAPIERMRVNLSGDSHWRFRNGGEYSHYLSWKDVAGVTGQFDYNPPKLISEFYREVPNLICN